MLTGQLLTLNFYSNPLEVIINKGAAYLHWGQLCDILGYAPDAPPHRLRQAGTKERYISLAFLERNLEDWTRVERQGAFSVIIRSELIHYVMKELGVLRELIPMIDINSETYLRGIFTHKDNSYITRSAVDRIAGHNCTISTEIPRYPVILLINNAYSSMISIDEDSLGISPQWVYSLDSLPAILETCRPQPQVRTNLTLSVGIRKDSSLVEPLGPRQRFDSPGVVGEHSCELDPDQKQRVEMSDEMTSKLMKINRWPENLSALGNGDNSER